MLAGTSLPRQLHSCVPCRFVRYRPIRRLGQCKSRSAALPEQNSSSVNGQGPHHYLARSSYQPLNGQQLKEGLKVRPEYNRPEGVPTGPKRSVAWKLGFQGQRTQDTGATAENIEKFWQRLALLFTGAVLLGERLTGQTAVERLNIGQTGVPLHETEPALLVVITLLLIAALYPSRTSIWTQIRSTSTPLMEKAQNILGRLAFLSLASIFTVEVMTGEGALTLMNIETGVEALSELEIGSAFIAMLLLTKPGSED